MEPVVFIDGSDFRMDDSADYYGLAPGTCTVILHK